MSRRLTVWLCVATSALATAYYLWDVNNQAVAQQAVQQASALAEQRIAAAPRAPTTLSGQPVRIVIPSLVIDLQVKPGQFDISQHTWLVDKSDADYIPSSAPITNKGSATFIYGHNSSSVLGKTKDIAKGALIYVYTDNGHLFTYSYASDTVVKPTDSAVLSDLNNGPGLMLMTCTGIWSQDRRIMTFTLESAV